MSVEVEYKQWKLPKLTAQQIADLADEIQAHKRARVIDEANRLNLSDDVKRHVIKDIERERLLAGDVILWAYSAFGTVRVFQESLKRKGNGLKVEDLDLDMAEDYATALRLLGFEPPEVPKDAAISADPTDRGGTRGT